MSRNLKSRSREIVVSVYDYFENEKIKTEPLLKRVYAYDKISKDQEEARNVEYKDPVEEEWERFQKEIKEEASASAELIAGEQDEATAERQIEEIDEQMRNWSRVLDIELKKEEINNKKQGVEQMSEDDNDYSDNDVDIDEFLDWRVKKAYR